MKACVMTAFGGPEVLELQDRPEPEPGPEDLLIRVSAAGVNPVDCKTRQAPRWGDRHPPMILGFDVCGEIVACGNRVDRFAIGDRIYASPSLIRDGAYAELVCVDQRTAAKAPVTLSDPEAAALPLVTLTAWESLFLHADEQPGETVLIHAGGGGVGHIAIQLAKHHGCRVLSTASSPDAVELARNCGADEVLNYKECDVPDTVLEMTDGVGCSVIVDTVGGAVLDQSISALATYGRIVAVVPGIQPENLNLLFGKNGTLHFEFMGAAVMQDLQPERQGEILRQAASLVDDGHLKPHVSLTWPLEDAAEAHRQQESGRTVGKQVLTVT